jgi:SAM-dependent methyltransferase
MLYSVKRSIVWFLDANRRFSFRLARRFPHTRECAHGSYLHSISKLTSEFRHAVILDLGAGRKSDYADQLTKGHVNIGLDISIDELRRNPDITYGVAANAEAALPFTDASFELICCCRLIEHLRQPEVLIAEMHRLLRNNGSLVLFFPSRNAAFALIKRLLPHELSKALIRAIHWPASKDFCWSRLYYRRCTAAKMTMSLRDAGFEIMDRHTDYYSSKHFAPLFPVFLIAICIEWLLHRIRFQPLASYVMITAKKVS